MRISWNGYCKVTNMMYITKWGGWYSSLLIILKVYLQEGIWFWGGFFRFWSLDLIFFFWYIKWLCFVAIHQHKWKKEENTSTPSSHLDYLLTYFKNKISSINNLETWEYLFLVWVAHHADSVCIYIYMCMYEREREVCREEVHLWLFKSIRINALENSPQRDICSFQRSLWQFGSKKTDAMVCVNMLWKRQIFPTSGNS